MLQQLAFYFSLLWLSHIRYLIFIDQVPRMNHADSPVVCQWWLITACKQHTTWKDKDKLLKHIRLDITYRILATHSATTWHCQTTSINIIKLSYSENLGLNIHRWCSSCQSKLEWIYIRIIIIIAWCTPNLTNTNTHTNTKYNIVVFQI